MYNEKSLVVGNLTIDRYAIGQYTQRLKNNTDGSLTSIYRMRVMEKTMDPTGWQLLRVDLTFCCVCICQRNRLLMEHGPYPTVQHTGE
ncbi:MAG TPA: hypothetical protein VE244_08195 [Nitrososphaeraceae archaeon]|jgi:hypothetical protein|nr:hypothetical protein [Nitrososphaeraceae archaeon]